MDLLDAQFFLKVRYKTAMANPHAALEALQCGPSTDSEKRYFGAKSIKCLKKNKFWPSKWRFFKNVALESIWVGHGCYKSFSNPNF